jgi:L-cysteine S-thiosulfotransferase
LFAVAPCLALSSAAAGPQHGGLVPYVIVGDSIPASLTGAKGDPVRGRAIVADRQVGMCLLCHSGPFPEDKFQGNIGPDLAGVGGRLSEGQLRLRIVDTSKIDPATIMPPFYRVDGLNRVPTAYRGKPVLTAVEIEDVVAYLTTLK